MRIKGNEWLGVKQVKEKMVLSEYERKMVGKGDEIKKGSEGSRKEGFRMCLFTFGNRPRGAV